MSLASGLTDRILIGVLVCAVPRDVVDEAVNAAGRQARRRSGKLPPYLVVYLVMALALFAGESYEEIVTKLTGSPAPRRQPGYQAGAPTSGGITQARQRLGPEPLEFLFRMLARPVTSSAHPGAYLRRWRLMAADGFELEVPGTPANVSAFGAPAGRGGLAGPKVRVLVISECASQANVDAQLGPGIGAASWHAMAAALYQRLDPGWLLIADPGFGGWAGWRAGAAAGAALLWRAGPATELPVLETLRDGSYLSRPADPGIGLVRVVEYRQPGAGAGQEPILLITTITDPADAAASELALAYQRCRDEMTGGLLSEPLSAQAAALRSKGPGLVRQEVFGRLLTRYALASASWRAAAGVGIDQDQGTAVRVVRR